MMPDPAHKPEYEFYATCSKGAEKVLAQELQQLNPERRRPLRIRPLTAGVAFFGTLDDAYRALLYLRVASRVLLVLDRVDASNADALYEGVRALPWEDHVAPDGTIAVDARGANDELRDERFIALKVKDAICDRFVELKGERPSVQRERPNLRINVALRNNKATVALDLAGEPLHRRGYRVSSGAIVAPLRETLAATMLELAGWGAKACGKTKGSDSSVASVDPTVFLLDPLCGSGTIVIEAALIALGRAPGLLRDFWGFEGWLGHDADLWNSLLDAADEQAEQQEELRQRDGSPVSLFASDVDPASVDVARESAKRAGVASYIQFEVADISNITLPQSGHGLLVTNPPYGERLSSSSQLPALYAALGQLKTTAAETLDLVAITPDDRIDIYLGGTSTQRIDTYNGSLETAIRIWKATGGTGQGAGQDVDSSVTQGSGQATAPSAGQGTKNNGSSARIDEDTPFVNRLRKMATHRAKWARRAGVSCYRVYDADLPDYAVAIDLYQGASNTPSEDQRWLHISEYEPPAEIDQQRAAERLADVLRIAPGILDVPTANVFLKQRKRSKGGEQYAQEYRKDGSPSSQAHLIRESGHLFEVDFARYLDTGIFLDHRLTRALLQDRAFENDCLNLFAYTGTASVYMAAGGAHSVTTIDLSNTYDEWAKRNMKRNRFRGNQYQFVQADVLRWVEEHRHDAEKYGLIFVDPPTFSNSARMGSRTWDVKRDHAELLIALSRMLTPDGVVVFSCNLRGFKPDRATLEKAKVHIENITKSTIPPDFERTQRIHHCYLVTKVK